MPELQLSAGPIDYEDTGAGPVCVFLHGVAMAGSVWRHVVAALAADFRCVVPTLPLGAHRRPMRADADLSLVGLGRLVAEFLERLDLRDVILVGNDIGLAQVVAADRPERIGRLVLTAQEAFDNYPPGWPGHAVHWAARVPGGLYALVQPLRLRALRRLPLAFGLMSKRKIPDAVTDAWLRPLMTQGEIRRDLAKYAGGHGKRDMMAATQRLASFNRPALVVWASEDRVMPRDHGERLAKLLPRGRLVEIPDSYTLIPEDQPAALARAIRQFAREPA